MLLLSDKTGYFYDGIVCSVTVKLNIERQRTEQAKQTPAKNLYSICEFREKENPIKEKNP